MGGSKSLRGSLSPSWLCLWVVQLCGPRLHEVHRAGVSTTVRDNSVVFPISPSRRQGVSEAKKKLLIPLSRLRGVVTRPEGLHPSHHQRPVAAGLTPTPRRRNQTRHCWWWWWCVPACRVHPEHESGCEDEDPENQDRCDAPEPFSGPCTLFVATPTSVTVTSERRFRGTRRCRQVLRKQISTCGGVGEAVETRDSRNSRRDNILFPSSTRSDCRHSIPVSSLAGRGLGHDIISPRLIRSAPNSARFPPLDPVSPQRQHGLPTRSSRNIARSPTEIARVPFQILQAIEVHGSSIHPPHTAEPPLPTPA